MAFKLGATNVFPGIFDFPTTAATGTMLYAKGANDTYWNYPGNPEAAVGSGFEFRSIFTHGYLAGGYKGFNPWRSVNKTIHSTDVTVYMGEQLAQAAEYIEGMFSDYNGYVLGCGPAFGGSYATTCSYSLATGIARSWSGDRYSPASTFGYTGDNPAAEGVALATTGGWDMQVARDTFGAASNQVGQWGISAGGASTTTDKLHFPTEIMYSTTASGRTGFTSGCSGETRGYFSFAGTRQYYTWSTDAWTAWTTSTSPDGWGKYLPSKLGYHIGESGANVTLPQMKFNDSTGADMTSFNKLKAYGESNFEMGQNWGYLLGQYDGQQNNYTVKYTYSTLAMTVMGAATRPKGHYGQSSGCCSSAAATVASNRPTYG